MKQKTQTNRSPRPGFTLAAILCYLVVATLLLGGISFSYFAATADGGDTATIALMASSLTIEVDEDATPKKPGDTRLVQVKVTNKEGNAICEVSQEYTLSAATVFGNLPLTFAFYTDNGGSLGTLIGTTAAGEFTQPGVESTAYYWLEITWPADRNSWTYAHELDTVRITAIAEQID